MKKFDPVELRKYVTGFRRRSLERRVQKKQKRLNRVKGFIAEEKRMRREDSRILYNQNCQIPILPNFRFADGPLAPRTKRPVEANSEDEENDEPEFAEKSVYTQVPQYSNVVVTVRPLHQPRSSTSSGDSAPPVSSASTLLPELMHNSPSELKKKLRVQTKLTPPKKKERSFYGKERERRKRLAAVKKPRRQRRVSAAMKSSKKSKKGKRPSGGGKRTSSGKRR
eukprot:RCo014782